LSSSSAKQRPWSASFGGGGQKHGSWGVLNWDCRGIRENESKAKTPAAKALASIFWGSEEILLAKLLLEMPHQVTATCAYIEEVKTTNLKGSAKQEDESKSSYMTMPHHIPIWAQMRQLQQWGGLSPHILLTVPI
jgi:hypothetical protein